MNNFYIYNHSFWSRGGADGNILSSTVIFCESVNINETNLQAELSTFYEFHSQTDLIIVIGGSYLRNELETIFIDKQESTFRCVPKLHRDYLKDNVLVYVFNEFGELELVNSTVNSIFKPTSHFFSNLFNDGLVKIFKKRGGLIESEGSSHHFVFPSGKHCNKFLRTGNVLLFSSEIYFIASQKIKYFKGRDYKQIFCDTSSINTLAFAVQDLQRRIIGEKYRMLPVESFTSYDVLYKGNAQPLSSSLILISASTSANILTRIIERHPMVRKENLVIIYFLGTAVSYNENKGQIICNLSKSKGVEGGIEFYDTYSNSDCIYCKSGSYPVEIVGDVFLLEKPKVNRITIRKIDAPKYLTGFVEEFISTEPDSGNFFKANYKEASPVDLKYEIYFNINMVLSEMTEATSRYKKFRAKLIDYINQFVPGKTKFLVHLPDEGSKQLALLISYHLSTIFREETMPRILSQDEISKIDKGMKGAIVIVASCISNGKNLLYLSRAFRNHEQARLVYFIGISRMKNRQAYEFLKSNLKQGKYGRDSSTLVEIENVFCVNEVKNTSWLVEKDFLLTILDYGEDVDMISDHTRKFIKERVEIIESSMSDSQKGLANHLFLPKPNLSGYLSLRKGFAFFEFIDYHHKVSQADVYFTISSVINNLRNSEAADHCLTQSEYVRNLIDPMNFNRFNDGVIQASILRSAKSEELAYKIDADISSDMRAIIEKMVKNHSQDEGEATLEFLYALAIQKLSLKDEHLRNICDLVNGHMTNEFAKLLCSYIKTNVLTEPKSLASENNRLSEENKKLKAEIETLSKN